MHILLIFLSALALSVYATVTPCCPKNEVYSECGNHGCQNTCANPDIAARCKAACNPGCICKNTYLRNTKNVCVPAAECDTCKACEIFDLYGKTECVNTCKEPNKMEKCVPERPIAGCICHPGYLRNDNNECVLPNKCEAGCGGDPNAEWSECGDPCPITCDNKDDQIACIAICQSGACKCKKGFVRDYRGKCILPNQCQKCGVNEFFNCGSACDTTCATLGEACTIINKKCVEMCYCKDGFARDDKGTCIPIDQCPIKQCKGDPNAIAMPCGDPCPVTCDNKNDATPRPCLKICIINGCKCKDGFVKGPDGKCIPSDKCPLKCGKNEIEDPCPSICSPELNCQSYFSGIRMMCPIILNRKCIPKCVCKDTYIRDSNGACVLPYKCCTDCNSELVASPNPCGGGTCAYPDFKQCDIRIAAFGCQCKKGFLKKSDTDPTCIPKEKCPSTPCCSVNEVYSECGNNACQNTCAKPNVAKICKAVCKSGCICKDGYLRNTKGVCVPAIECDTCGENEVFDLCGNTGCVNTCKEPDLITRCTPAGCNAGCICKDGYIRSDEGKCVRPQECIPGTCDGDPNAEFAVCGDTCPTTCENKDEGPRACPMFCLSGGGCKCKPDYVKDYRGKCILPENCPKCGVNEFFNCGSACDTTCATLGEQCPIVNIKCTEMCYCKDGFARDNCGVCIPVAQCPPKQCPTDPNAIVVPCGDPCPTTCENKDSTEPNICPAICFVNGCKCKPGYVIGYDGKCILQSKCPTCAKNEVYDKCPAPDMNCSTYFSGPDVCPILKCNPGCRCQDDYVRNEKGRCVAATTCCKDTNSELVSCPNPCPGGTCEHPEFSPCKVKCMKYGCQCKKGFVKKSITDNTCIPLASCCKRS